MPANNCMVPPHGYKCEQSVEEIKSHESMRSDRMTRDRMTTQGQIDTESFQSTALPSFSDRRRYIISGPALQPFNLIDIPGPPPNLGVPLHLVCIRPGRGTWLHRYRGASLLGSLSLRMRGRSSLPVRTLGRHRGSWRGSSL